MYVRSSVCFTHDRMYRTIKYHTKTKKKKIDDKIQTQTNNIGLVNLITAWIVLVIVLRQLKLEESPPHDQSNQNPHIVYIIYAYIHMLKRALFSGGRHSIMIFIGNTQSTNAADLSMDEYMQGWIQNDFHIYKHSKLLTV